MRDQFLQPQASGRERLDRPRAVGARPGGSDRLDIGADVGRVVQLAGRQPKLDILKHRGRVAGIESVNPLQQPLQFACSCYQRAFDAFRIAGLGQQAIVGRYLLRDEQPGQARRVASLQIRQVGLDQREIAGGGLGVDLLANVQRQRAVHKPLDVLNRRSHVLQFVLLGSDVRQRLDQLAIHHQTDLVATGKQFGQIRTDARQQRVSVVAPEAKVRKRRRVALYAKANADNQRGQQVNRFVGTLHGDIQSPANLQPGLKGPAGVTVQRRTQQRQFLGVVTMIARQPGGRRSDSLQRRLRLGQFSVAGRGDLCVEISGERSAAPFGPKTLEHTFNSIRPVAHHTLQLTSFPPTHKRPGYSVFSAFSRAACLIFLLLSR